MMTNRGRQAGMDMTGTRYNVPLHRWLIGTGIVCILTVLLVWMATPLSAESQSLPYRPPLTPAPEPKRNLGARIELNVRPTQQGQIVPWSGLWTAVQWQDLQGDWQYVEGWRGSLDLVQDDQGKKVWWVAKKDFGKRLFRWMVCDGEDGQVLAYSESFHLPDAPYQIKTVEVVLP